MDFFEYTKDVPDHLSVSAVNTYLKCQVQYYFKYLTDIPKPKIARLVHGSAVHAGIANNLTQRMCGNNDCNESIELAEQFFEEATKDDNNILYDKVFFNKDVAIRSIAKILNQALPEIEELIQHPMLSEWALTDSGISVELCTKQKVIGYVDCVDTEGNIYDFKVTGNANSIQDATQSLQLGVYSYFLPQPSKKVGLISISNKTGKVTPAIVTCGQQRGINAINALDMAAKNIQSSIENRSFIPNTEGWHCSSNYCDYFSVCPWGGK